MALLTTATTDLGNWFNEKLILYLDDLANSKKSYQIIHDK